MNLPEITATDLRRTVPVLGALRLGFASVMTIRAAAISRGLGLGEEAAMVTRMAGGRELALGIGTIEAWRRGQPTYGWVAAQAVSDAGDTVAFVLAARAGVISRTRGYGLALFALGGVVAGAATAYALRREQL
jgi:hypothetical protein